MCRAKAVSVSTIRNTLDLSKPNFFDYVPRAHDRRAAMGEGSRNVSCWYFYLASRRRPLPFGKTREETGVSRGSPRFSDGGDRDVGL